MAHHRLVGAGRRLSADRTSGLHICFTGFGREAVEAFYAGVLEMAAQTTAFAHSSEGPPLFDANGRADGEFPGVAGGYDPAIKIGPSKSGYSARLKTEISKTPRPAHVGKQDQIVARSL